MKRALPLLAFAFGLSLCAPAAARPAPLAPLALLRGGPTVEDVVVQTSDNVRLAGSFFAPRSKGRAHAVLLVHDAGGDRKQLEKLGQQLQKAGFAVLSLDLRGHGASASEAWDWGKLDADGRARTWVFTQRDLSAAAEFLRTRDDVHSASLTLVGHRSGGGAVVRYAADDLNVRAVVVLDPVQDELGFNLLKDLVALEELQTLLLAPNAARQNTERLVQAGMDATGGSYQWIHPCFLKSESSDLLEDKRLGREVCDWLKETVLPNKDDR